MTAFTVYNDISNDPGGFDWGGVVWLVGGLQGSEANRGFVVLQDQSDFTVWTGNYIAPFVVPTDTFRICTDRVNTNLSTVDIFDSSANSETNFSLAMGGLETPSAGYFVGGLNTSLTGDGRSRCFDGDIAELIIYRGYLSDADRLKVANYLEQKYFQSIVSTSLSYQWQFDGTDLDGATNAT